MQEPEQNRKILNPHRDGFIRDCEISYHDGAYYVQSLEENALIDEPKKIEPPFDIVSYKAKEGGLLTEKEEISIIQSEDRPHAYQRKLNNQGQQDGNLAKFNSNSVTWDNLGNYLVNPIDQGAFTWHNQRNIRVQFPAQNEDNRAFHAQSPLAPLQKTNIMATLNDQIDDFRSSCTSPTEYTQGLHAVIHNEDPPEFLSTATPAKFNALKAYLSFETISRIPVNDRNQRGETGQFATSAEVKQYAQLLLQNELQKSNNAYEYELMALENGQWQLLCPVVSQERLQDPSTELGIFINENLRAITKIYNPKDTRTLQEQAAGVTPPVQLREIANPEPGADNSNKITPQDLITANQALTNILYHLKNDRVTSDDHRFYNSSFVKQTVGFLWQLMNVDLALAASRQNCQLLFLEPLQELTRAKILELNPDADASVLNPEPELAPGEPRPRPQQPQPETIEVEGKNLLDPGMRAKLKQWFIDKELDPPVHDTNKKTLSGTLSNGTHITMKGSSIAIEKADDATKLTDEALKEATDEIADMLIKAYGGAQNVPPLKVTGTKEQKELIAERLRDLGLQVQGGGQEPPVRHEAGVRNHP